MIKNVSIFVVGMAIVLLGWAVVVDENAVRNLRAENSSLKSEITATRAATDVASIFASDHDGVIRKMG